MKTLPLTLAKEILIVEVPFDDFTDISVGTHCIGVKTTEDVEKDSNGFYHIYSNGLFFGEIGKTFNFICKATDLTEDIAAELVEKVMNGQHFQNYNAKGIIDRWCKTALDSFKSAIQQKGFYWGINPYQSDWDELCQFGFVTIHGKTCSKSDRYDNAKDRTFNLKQTLIFERVWKTTK